MGPSVGSSPTQALSHLLCPQLPLATSALAGGCLPLPPSTCPLPAQQHDPDSDLSGPCLPRPAEGTSFLQSLGTQDRSGPSHPSASSPWRFGFLKAHSGGWAEVCIFS